MAGANRTIEIDAPIDVVFGVISDYEKYPEFLDDVSGCKILERTSDGAVVEQTLNLVKTVSYSIRIHETPNTGIHWELHKSKLMKTNDGRWVLEDLGDGRTKATYSLEVRAGMWVPGKIVDSLTGVTLPKTMEAFKKRAESLK